MPINRQKKCCAHSSISFDYVTRGCTTEFKLRIQTCTQTCSVPNKCGHPLIWSTHQINERRYVRGVCMCRQFSRRPTGKHVNLSKLPANVPVVPLRTFAPRDPIPAGMAN